MIANLTWLEKNKETEEISPLQNILLKPHASRVEFKVKAEKEQEDKGVKDQKISYWESNNLGRSHCHEINLNHSSRMSTPIRNTDGSPNIGFNNFSKPHHPYHQQQTHYFTTTAFPVLTPIRTTTAEKAATSTHFSCLDMKILDEQDEEKEMLLSNPKSKSPNQTEIKRLYDGSQSPGDTSTSGFHSDSETHEVVLFPTQALHEVGEEIDRTFSRLQERIDPVKSKILLRNFKLEQDNNNNKN